MKIKYSFLTLAVLALSMLVTNPSFAQSNSDTNTLAIPGTKTIGELLKSLSPEDRSNYVALLEREASNAAAGVNKSNLQAQAKSVLSEAATGAKQTVETNINQVMVEILSGVKNASGEIYHFSKQEIAKGYDFVKGEAPQVVKEFLTWQVVKSVVWILVFSSIACIMFYFGRVFKQNQSKKNYYEEDFAIMKWLIRIAASGLLIATLGVNGMNIAKVCFAPRVYIIEYVMDLSQGHAQNYR